MRPGNCRCRKNPCACQAQKNGTLMVVGAANGRAARLSGGRTAKVAKFLAVARGERPPAKNARPARRLARYPLPMELRYQALGLRERGRVADAERLEAQAHRAEARANRGARKNGAILGVMLADRYHRARIGGLRVPPFDQWIKQAAIGDAAAERAAREYIEKLERAPKKNFLGAPEWLLPAVGGGAVGYLAGSTVQKAKHIASRVASAARGVAAKVGGAASPNRSRCRTHLVRLTPAKLEQLRRDPRMARAIDGFRAAHGALPTVVRTYDYSDGGRGVVEHVGYSMGKAAIRIDVVEDKDGNEVSLKEPLDIDLVYSVDPRKSPKKSGGQYYHGSRAEGGRPGQLFVDAETGTKTVVGGTGDVRDGWLEK